MHPEHKLSFISELAILGFEVKLDNYFDRLIDSNVKNFYLETRKTKSGLVADYKVHASYNESEGFSIDRVDATLIHHGPIRHIKNFEVNTEELESRMKGIDWNSIGHMAGQGVENNPSPEKTQIYHAAKRVVEDVNDLCKLSTETKKLADQLAARYWLNTAAEQFTRDAAVLRQEYVQEHQFAMGKTEVAFTATEMVNLMRGKPVYKILPDYSTGAWHQLSKNEEGRELQQFAQHYNFDVKQFLGALPWHQVQTDMALDVAQLRLLNGGEVNATLVVDGQPQHFYISADPMHRTLHISSERNPDMEINPEDIGIRFPAVRQVERYELYDGQQKITGGNDYQHMQQKLQEYIEKQDDRKDYWLTVYGVPKGHQVTFDEGGKQVNEAVVPVISTEVYARDSFLMHELVPAGDVMSAAEENIRNQYKNEPFLRETSYRCPEIVDKPQQVFTREDAKQALRKARKADNGLRHNSGSRHRPGI